MIQYILVEDAVCAYKGKVYAKIGDTVTLVANHGRALIVEDSKGERFAINSKNIISYKNQPEQVIHKKSDYVEEKPTKKIRSKKAAEIALTLF